jgi:hypothetical protein
MGHDMEALRQALIVPNPERVVAIHEVGGAMTTNTPPTLKFFLHLRSFRTSIRH